MHSLAKAAARGNALHKLLTSEETWGSYQHRERLAEVCSWQGASLSVAQKRA